MDILPRCNVTSNVTQAEKPVPRLWPDDASKIVSYMAKEAKLSASHQNILKTAIEFATQSNSYACTASRRSLIEHSGHSRATLGRAFAALEHRGLIYNKVRPGNGKNLPTARVFADDFIALIAHVSSEAKRLKMKWQALSKFARKLYREFVDKPVDTCPEWGSSCAPCEGEMECADGAQAEPQNTLSTSKDLKTKNKSNKKTLRRPFSFEFLFKLRDIETFLREGIESRKRDIKQYYAQKANGRAKKAHFRQPKEDPMFPASYAGKVYTKPEWAR